MRHAIADGADVEECEDEEDEMGEGEGEGEGEDEGDELDEEAEGARGFGTDGTDRATEDEDLPDASPEHASLEEAAGDGNPTEVVAKSTEVAAKSTEVAGGSGLATGAEGAAGADAEAGAGAGPGTGASETASQAWEHASSGGEPPTDQIDADSEVALLSDRAQADSTVLSRAESSLGESHSVLAAEEWSNVSRGDDAPGADEDGQATRVVPQEDEARRTAGDPGQTWCTPEEILHMHVAHFRDVRRFARAQYARSLRPHHRRLAALLRVGASTDKSSCT
jgi:hypothetical protein